LVLFCLAVKELKEDNLSNLRKYLLDLAPVGQKKTSDFPEIITAGMAYSRPETGRKRPLDLSVAEAPPAKKQRTGFPLSLVLKSSFRSTSFNPC
jgi:hypothetical protein